MATLGLYSKYGNIKLGRGKKAIGCINRMPGPTQVENLLGESPPQDVLDALLATGVDMAGRPAGPQLIQRGTCPGATDWCKANCYGLKGRYIFQYAKYAQPLNLPAQPTRYVRIHAVGDFDCVAYINEIIAYVRDNPDTRFWAYTHSWAEPELLAHLEYLRAEPNVQLFASMDPSSASEPPAGWRKAYIDGTFDQSGPVCMEMTGAKATCFDCGYCFKGKRGNVVFKPH